ncbi:hypothetical protein ING2E5A_0389 [Petrimonas mucosa]|uniref:Uncharacterized protein n=1 Tax=Petrimonas mucosa TaxID=1642646 RepID=A0A1G4G459_9BACT|nr:hypothetical protein ING2E5A_0389 [Petrimonas mucosa]
MISCLFFSKNKGNIFTLNDKHFHGFFCFNYLSKFFNSVLF